jgi:hypothetical protein
MPQCQATTLASSYSPSHRCLRTTGLRKIRHRHLCVVHRRMAGAAAPRVRPA